MNTIIKSLKTEKRARQKDRRFLLKDLFPVQLDLFCPLDKGLPFKRVSLLHGRHLDLNPTCPKNNPDSA